MGLGVSSRSLILPLQVVLWLKGRPVTLSVKWSHMVQCAGHQHLFLQGWCCLLCTMPQWCCCTFISYGTQSGG